MKSVHVCFVGNRVDLNSRVGDGGGEAGGKLMEEYCRQMCVCHDGDDGVHCIRYWEMAPNNHHLDLKSQLRPWSLKFLSHICVIDNWLEKKVEKVQ